MALAVAALGACDGHGTSAGKATAAKSLPAGGPTVSPAPPGKYRTLPQPCVALDLDALKQLVPGAGDYSGTESLTYDTDRRVGCKWQGRTPDGTARTLSVDLERVVSYDPAISDEVQAGEDFDQQAAAHQIGPSAPTSTAATTDGATAQSSSDGSSSGSSDTAGSSGTAGSSAGADASGGTSTSGTSGASGTAGTAGGTANASGGSTNGGSGTAAPDLAPRRLTDLGNDAFLDDVTKGSARRDVTVVFRTANVLVTVVYSETAAKGAPRPDSARMQQAAQQAAAQLERKVEK